MIYVLKVLHTDRNSHVVFQTTYSDLAKATGHVTEIAAKYPPGFTITLYDGAGTVLTSEHGTKAGIRYDHLTKEMIEEGQ